MAFLSSGLVACAGASPQQKPPASDMVMNGLSLAQFGDFAQSWHLVTVRFRQDTGEQRFTYANDLAWRTLSSNRTDFPEAAAFAKIAVQTQPDPSFTSSAVPSGARRIQFMVKDGARAAATDGWTYALFDTQGHVFPGDPSLASAACAACHRLVPERGFVFSQPMALLDQFTAPAVAARLPLVFRDVEVAQLPGQLRALLRRRAPGVHTVRGIVGPITAHSFYGTLDEIRPTLEREVVRSHFPGVFVSDDGTDFSVVFEDPKQKCNRSGGAVALAAVHTLHEGAKVGLHEMVFCQNLGL